MRKVLYFNITYRCNQHCRFCFSHNTNGCGLKQDIDVGDFKQILNKWTAKVGDRVVINGGEPTLHARLFDLLNASADTEAETVMYSNGVRFADFGYCKRIMATGLNRVTIPIHGDENVHDCATGVSGSYDRTVAGIKNIIQCGFGKKLELKFIISCAMAQNHFSPASFMAEYVGNSKLSSIVVAGMVNTRIAQKYGWSFKQDETFLNYVANATMDLRNDIPVKLYDIELCNGDAKFQTWIHEHKAVGAAPVYKYVFFDAENLGGKRLSYKSLRTEVQCRDCQLKESCRSIVSGYNVLCLSGDQRCIVME